MITGRKIALLLAAPAMLLTSACGSDDAATNETESAGPAEKTLAEMLGNADGMGKAASALTETGLATVLDATPNYTVLAPTDAAFDAFAPAGSQGGEVSVEDQRAAMSAVMRAHILPGYLTVEDINRAIDAADGGTVTMHTMADTPLTFTREGTTIKVSSADGASATISGTPMSGTNGVLLPIDAVLKQL